MERKDLCMLKSVNRPVKQHFPLPPWVPTWDRLDCEAKTFQVYIQHTQRRYSTHYAFSELRIVCMIRTGALKRYILWACEIL